MDDPHSHPAVPADDVALFLDVDGTLIDIASRPDAVVVPGELLQTLATLEAQLDGAIALVSGRPIAELDRLFHPLRLRASGVHGAETRIRSGVAVTASPSSRLPDGAASALAEVAAGFSGTLIEDKGFSVAVHYRANPAAGPRLHQALTELVARWGSDLQILPGHMVFEVKRAAFDKGLAVAAFMSQPPSAGRRPVFIGDDVTDLPAFTKVLSLGGLAFSVTTPREGCSGHFTSPAQVRAWLNRLAERDMPPGLHGAARR